MQITKDTREQWLNKAAKPARAALQGHRLHDARARAHDVRLPLQVGPRHHAPAHRRVLDGRGLRRPAFRDLHFADDREDDRGARDARARARARDRRHRAQARQDLYQVRARRAPRGQAARALRRQPQRRQGQPGHDDPAAAHRPARADHRRARGARRGRMGRRARARRAPGRRRRRAVHRGARRKTFFEMVEHRFKVRPGPELAVLAVGLEPPVHERSEARADRARGAPLRQGARLHDDRELHGHPRAGERRPREAGPSAATSATASPAATWFEWLPIHELKRRPGLRHDRGAGQEPHWAYAAGNERLSCVFCIMGSARDLANGAKHRPDLLAKYVEIEQRTGYTMHMSRKPLLELRPARAPRTSSSASPSSRCQ
jgi:hypothetical protein